MARTDAELVSEALDRFDEPATSVAALVRTTIRVAWRRKDYATLVRLLPETFDLAPGTVSVDRDDWREARRELAAVLGVEAAHLQIARLVMRQQADRKHPDGSGQVFGLSIDQVEQRVAWLQRERAALADEAADASAGHRDELARLSMQVEDGLAQFQAITARVRQSVHVLLLQAERELRAGDARPSTVTRAMEYATRRLRDVCPAALVELEAADAALQGDASASDRSHAATSCRRAVDALADALFPARDEPAVGADGVARAMRGSINRLTQFVTETAVSGPASDVLVARLHDFHRLLGRQYNLASKGVHGDVNQDEIEVLVTWTWMLAAQLLRMQDGTATFDAAPEAPVGSAPAEDRAPHR